MVALEYYLVCLHLDSSRQDARTCLCRCVCVCVCVMMIVIVVVYGCACMQCYLLSLYLHYLCTSTIFVPPLSLYLHYLCTSTIFVRPVSLYVHSSRKAARTCLHRCVCMCVLLFVIPQNDIPQAVHGAKISEHTTTHCTTRQLLQHAATHWQFLDRASARPGIARGQRLRTHCNTLQHNAIDAATNCNTPQHTAKAATQ